MAEKKSNNAQHNSLYSFSIKKPWILVITLFLLAVFFKYIDNFALRLDELVGEAILTKALGLLMVFLYLRWAGRSMKDIGFQSHYLGKILLLAGLGFILVYVIAFLAQLVAFQSAGEKVQLVITAVDPKTGMTGGLLFGLWMLAANLINSAMEEGLFRGVMMRHLMIRLSGWGAILVSAGFFAVWHLSWPLRHYLDGTSTLGEAAFEAFTLMLATFIAGIVYGYLYLKTDNLWGAFLGHTINNTVLNVLYFQTGSGIQAAASLLPFQILMLLGYLVLLPVINIVTKKINAPEVKPWSLPEGGS